MPCCLSGAHTQLSGPQRASKAAGSGNGTSEQGWTSRAVDQCELAAWPSKDARAILGGRRDEEGGGGEKTHIYEPTVSRGEPWEISQTLPHSISKGLVGQQNESTCWHPEREGKGLTSPSLDSGSACLPASPSWLLGTWAHDVASAYLHIFLPG